MMKPEMPRTLTEAFLVVEFSNDSATAILSTLEAFYNHRDPLSKYTRVQQDLSDLPEDFAALVKAQQRAFRESANITKEGVQGFEQHCFKVSYEWRQLVAGI